MVLSPIVLIGMRFNSEIVCGAALGTSTLYSLLSFHPARFTEKYHNGHTACIQHPVDRRNIHLSFEIGWIFDRHLRPEVQTDRFIDKRERSADERLRCNHRGDSRNRDAEGQKPSGNN